MLVKFIRFFVAVLMMISPTLPHTFGLPAIPKGQSLDLDSRFELVWNGPAYFPYSCVYQ